MSNVSSGTVTELSVVHYGDTANDLMKQLACFGSSYASAVYVQEQSVIDFNDPAFTEKAGCANDRRHDTLTPIAPSGGTFVADYPCYALARPEASAESTAATLFCSWLADWFKKAPGGAEANTVALSDLDGGQLTDLRDGLARMRAADDDALWDGIWNSVRMVREGPRDARIRAVVVLTDGTDGSDTSFHHWDELEG